MTILNTKELPIILEHLTIVYGTVYRLIRSVTLLKSIGSAKPGKARVINFKARAKPKARALKNTGLFSITNYKWYWIRGSYLFDLMRRNELKVSIGFLTAYTSLFHCPVKFGACAGCIHFVISFFSNVFYIFPFLFQLRAVLLRWINTSIPSISTGTFHLFHDLWYIYIS